MENKNQEKKSFKSDVRKISDPRVLSQLSNSSPPEHKDFTTELISAKSKQDNGMFFKAVLRIHTHTQKENALMETQL